MFIWDVFTYIIINESRVIISSPL